MWRWNTSTIKSLWKPLSKRCLELEYIHNRTKEIPLLCLVTFVVCVMIISYLYYAIMCAYNQHCYFSKPKGEYVSPDKINHSTILKKVPLQEQQTPAQQNGNLNENHNNGAPITFQTEVPPTPDLSKENKVWNHHWTKMLSVFCILYLVWVTGIMTWVALWDIYSNCDLFSYRYEKTS